jgi:hypothetical protein
MIKETRIMAISNHTTSARGFYEVLGSEPFQRGYEDVRRGLPPSYDAYKTVREQTRYERGRLFSSVDSAKGKTLRVCTDTVDRFKAARDRKEVV